MIKSADILVIDDEQVIVDAVIKICSLESYSAEAVLSVKHALEKIHKHKYSIIICDIMMPDGDGFQVLNELQINNIGIPLIMMTGYSTVENAVNSLYQGAIDFIPKPFTVDELLSSVFRAQKYQAILEKQKQSSVKNKQVELYYVDCPSKYSRLGHSSWMVEERDGSVLFGVCDIFLKTIDSVVEIEFLENEEEIAQGISCLTIKSSDDRLHKILSPVSGRIIEVNESLKLNPSKIEKDPYFDGWVYRIIPADLGYEIKKLIPCSSDRMEIRAT
jgi:FixJ family two-component response regulator/glycine cleavage system H lipoate-binding protein